MRTRRRRLFKPPVKEDTNNLPITGRKSRVHRQGEGAMVSEAVSRRACVGACQGKEAGSKHVHEAVWCTTAHTTQT